MLLGTNTLDHVFYLIIGQFKKQWQSHKAIAVVVRLGQVAAIVFVLVKWTGMEAQIMEDRPNVVLFQFCNKRIPLFRVLANDVKHVRIIGGKAGDIRQHGAVFSGPADESVVILLPDGFAACLDFFEVFKLRPKKRTDNFGWKK